MYLKNIRCSYIYAIHIKIFFKWQSKQIITSLTLTRAKLHVAISWLGSQSTTTKYGFLTCAPYLQRLCRQDLCVRTVTAQDNFAD